MGRTEDNAFVKVHSPRKIAFNLGSGNAIIPLEISLVTVSEVISVNAGDGKVLKLADGEAGGGVSTRVRLRESDQTDTDSGLR